MSRAPVRRTAPSLRPAPGPAPTETRPTGPLPTIPAEIDTILFSILTQQDLIDAGAPQIYKKEDPIANNQESLNGSLYDPRMGYSSYWNACATCFLSQAECPGHIGYISFRDKAWVIYPFAGSLIASLLNVLCQHCGRPLFRTEDIAEYRLDRLSLVARVKQLEEVLPTTSREGIRCAAPLEETRTGCLEIGNKIAKYSESDNTIYLVERTARTNAEREPMDPGRIYKLFTELERIAKTEKYSKVLENLGFRSFGPSDLILTFLTIVPPCIREVTSKGFGVKSKDHLKREYLAVLSIINSLEAPQTTKRRGNTDVRQTLNTKILTLYGLKSTKGRGNGDEFRGYKQIESSKKGIPRGKMQGKRLDTTGRTVVVPDPTIEPGYIGVPRVMADPTKPNTLYERISVTSFNHEYLEELREQGLVTRYFPAGQRGDGKLLTDKVPKFEFQPRDEVGRPIQDGSIIIFNRNPSIHRISVLACKVKLVDGLAFRIRPDDVTKYNMDFDGDETNIKVVMRWTSRAEARYVAATAAHAINAENSTASNGLIQDNITGAFMMTNPTDIPFAPVSGELVRTTLAAMLHQEDVQTLEQRLSQFGLTVDSPRGLLSASFPASFGCRSGDVMVFLGIAYQGTIKKSHVGAGTRGSIQHYLAHYDYIYGVEREGQFLKDASTVTGAWISGQRGFSVGFEDTLVENPRIEELRARTNNRVRAIVQQIDYRPDDEVELARVERDIAGVLSQAEGLGIKVTDEVMVGSNPVRIMVKSGAKGNFVHLANITAMLGQQFVFNARTPLDMTDGTRSTAYSRPGSTDPADRGWSISNYNIGLSPLETFTQQVATRPLLADTSLKTGDVGDLAHRVGLALENMIIQYDGTLRDANKMIVDPFPGPEGFDPMRLLPQDDGSLFYLDIESLVMIANAEVLLAEQFTV